MADFIVPNDDDAPVVLGAWNALLSPDERNGAAAPEFGIPLYLLPDGRVVASRGSMTGMGARRIGMPMYVDSGDGIDASKVALQLHCEGANLSTVLVDSSQYARAFTISGSPYISTLSKVFGESSLYLPADQGFVTASHPSLDMRAGAFQFDWRHRLVSNLTSYSQPDVVIAMLDGGTWSYEWAVVVDRDGLRFYYGRRGTNNAHLRFILPPGIDFGTLGGVFAACRIARDSDGNWGAWVNGLRCTSYQISPLSIGFAYGSVITGTYNNPVDFGDSESTAGRLSIGKFGPYTSLSVPKYIDELRYVVGQSCNVFEDYVPMNKAFADPEQ